jgi:hypothetical protein
VGEVEGVSDGDTAQLVLPDWKCELEDAVAGICEKRMIHISYNAFAIGKTRPRIGVCVK